MGGGGVWWFLTYLCRKQLLFSNQWVYKNDVSSKQTLNQFTITFTSEQIGKRCMATLKIGGLHVFESCGCDVTI